MTKKHNNQNLTQEPNSVQETNPAAAATAAWLAVVHKSPKVICYHCGTTYDVLRGNKMELQFFTSRDVSDSSRSTEKKYFCNPMCCVANRQQRLPRSSVVNWIVTRREMATTNPTLDINDGFAQTILFHCAEREAGLADDDDDTDHESIDLDWLEASNSVGGVCEDDEDDYA